MRARLVSPLALALLALSALLPNQEIRAQGSPPLQEQQDSLLPPSLRGMAPRAQPTSPAPTQVTPTQATPTQVPPTQAPPTQAPSAQAPSAQATPSDSSGATAPAGPAPDMTPQVQWPNKWVSAGTAKLQALDKVNAQAQPLTVKVGQTVTFETLSITVKSCVVRPPDQPADAAAFLDVTDSHPEAPGFTGWMLANEPSVSMMQSPIYDIRVVGCT